MIAVPRLFLLELKSKHFGACFRSVIKAIMFATLEIEV